MSLAITSKPGDTRLTRWKRILTKYQLVNNGSSVNNPRSGDTLRVTIERVLKCIRAGSTDITTPDAPTNFDISDSSTTSAIALSWNQSSIPTFNEVHRSANGGAFSLMAVLPGSATIYTDTNGIPTNTYWTYKVRAVSGATGPFCATRSIGRNLNYNGTGITSISLGDMVVHLGNLSFSLCASLTSVSCPILRKITTGSLAGSDSTLLSSIDFSALASVGVRISLSNTALVSLSFPALTTTGTGSIFDPLAIASTPSLTSTNFPVLVLQNNGAVWDLSANALDAPSINQFLARGVASATTTDNYSLAGGSNAAPTGQGATDKATLVTAGNIVSTN